MSHEQFIQSLKPGDRATYHFSARIDVPGVDTEVLVVKNNSTGVTIEIPNKIGIKILKKITARETHRLRAP